MEPSQIKRKGQVRKNSQQRLRSNNPSFVQDSTNSIETLQTVGRTREEEKKFNIEWQKGLQRKKVISERESQQSFISNKKTKSNTEKQLKADINFVLKKLNQKYINKKFDTVSEIVDILLDQDSQVIFRKISLDLEEVKFDLDEILKDLCENRDQDFNNILFSVRPLEQQLNELGIYVEGLNKSSKIIKEELMTQGNLQNLRNIEMKSLYYQEMIDGLKIFEKIERYFEDIDFLFAKNNILSASQTYSNLNSLIFNDKMTKTLLNDFGVTELMKKRIWEKQRVMLDSISSSILDILFIRNEETCAKRLNLVQQFLQRNEKYQEDEIQIIEAVCNDDSHITKMHEYFQKSHRKDFENAQKAEELVKNQELDPQESVATGLICLQKEKDAVVKELNISYLVVLLISFHRISDCSIQEFLKQKMDVEMQGLCTRIIQTMLDLKKKTFSKPQSVNPNKALRDLLQINAIEVRKNLFNIQTIFFFFQSCLNYFMITDKITSADEKSQVSLDYVNCFLYYMKMIIQVLFDHERRIVEFNNKNSIIPQQQTHGQMPRAKDMDRKMRFSFKTVEEQESFLADSVKLKLDYIHKLEDMMVPQLISKNISLVMLFGNKFLNLIQGFVQLAEKNLSTSQENENKLSMQAFYSWMKRFIVTNYEIFLDYFKSQSDMTASKYFSKPLFNEQTSAMLKTSMNFENFQKSIIAAQKASLLTLSRAFTVGPINLDPLNDNLGLWIIFDYVSAFAYVAQLAVARIPLEEKNKADQAQFRQEVLEGLCKVSKRVLDKIMQFINLCFQNTHKDKLFSPTVYASEKLTNQFRCLIRQEGVKYEESKDTIDQQEFLFKPKIAMNSNYLSNSVTSLTVLLQIYQRLKDIALKEFSSSFTFITNRGEWDKKLDEGVRKDYQKNINEIEELIWDILVFFKCELATRTYSHMREMTKTDFTGHTAASRLEGFALSLTRDIKVMYNFMSQVLIPQEMFYLFSFAQFLSFKLFAHNVKQIKRQEVDEMGYQRLKGSLFHLKVEMDMLVPKLLIQQSQPHQEWMKIIQIVKSQVAKEYEKAIYVLEILDCEESEVPLKIKENDYDLKFSDFEALLSIKTAKHEPFSDLQKDALRKMFGNK